MVVHHHGDIELPTELSFAQVSLDWPAIPQLQVVRMLFRTCIDKEKLHA
jgi:hypothetical protein